MEGLIKRSVLIATPEKKVRVACIQASKSSSILEGRAGFEDFVMVQKRGLQPIYELLPEDEPQRNVLQEAVGYLRDAGEMLTFCLLSERLYALLVS